MVGGLVEQKKIGGFEQELAQGNTTAFSARQDVDGHVGIRALERIHGLTQLGI